MPSETFQLLRPISRKQETGHQHRGEQVGNYPSQVVEYDRYLLQRPVGGREQTLAARTGHLETADAPVPLAAQQRELQDAEGDESVARQHSADQVSALMKNHLEQESQHQGEQREQRGPYQRVPAYLLELAQKLVDRGIAKYHKTEHDSSKPYQSSQQERRREAQQHLQTLHDKYDKKGYSNVQR